MARGFGEGFPPKSIAVVGVSREQKHNHPGYTGLQLFRSLRDAGFQGAIYLVNPNADEVDGVRMYPRVTELPERPDLVTVTVPPPAVPVVIEDCAKAGVLNVQVCTSGFAETGQPEAMRLQEEMTEIALRGGIRLVGPNCMGFQVPSVRMRMFDDVPLVEGPVAFVSQSGGHCRHLMRIGPERGIGFSKVISYGNAAVVGATDFVEYLADDPETRVVCMYLEGVPDGRRLFDLVRKLVPVKPLVIWKAGVTGSGVRAAVSHTGSLAGEACVWHAFFEQTGAIGVGSMEEMADVAQLLLHIRPPRGKRVAVVSSGGGNSVATGDICAQEGLDMPPVSGSTREGLLEFLSLVNQGIANPLDLPAVLSDAPKLRRTLELLDADPVVDMVVLYLSGEYFEGTIGGPMTGFDECVLEFNRSSEKQVVVAFSEEGGPAMKSRSIERLRERGLVVFESLRTACRALRRYAEYASSRAAA